MATSIFNNSLVTFLLNKPFFLKLHTGIGWAEVFKNLVQLRLPVTSASNEYKAVLALQRAGVYTLAVGAYALEGWNPAALRSMIVTSELTGTVTLEDYCANWTEAPPAATTSGKAGETDLGSSCSGMFSTA